ncbi:hypothetical protein BB559_004110 [Furculomyces boomerangus]|uniref:tRNA N(3)-methylcytidine methyltransferase n=2 Tax=Harpellales TaxID=61421 RepID=A0A2T9YGR8_9FUNG|nr:hypothetical protein BB559_004110 [Furculomyces boomerangus]PVZ97444.1 hypothetical protein BB558_006609 [Smittium angustum]PVZ99323.1 hypothetical protein BB558_004657 [Smittium angustum]
MDNSKKNPKLFSSVVATDPDSSSLNPNKKPKTMDEEEKSFGGRFLDKDKDVFAHNAWDSVEPDQEYLEYAETRLKMHKETRISKENVEKYNSDPNKFWDTFYSNNQNKFFKDRNWFYIEFPELFSWTNELNKDVLSEKLEKRDVAKHPESEKVQESQIETDTVDNFVIMELGCGAGNAVFPLLKTIQDKRLEIIACDYSKVAVDVVKSTDTYQEDKRCKAFVWDITDKNLPDGVEPGTVDVILCIFVLSAIHPDSMSQVVSNLHKLLKPGGLVLFRDYGKYDLAQVRLKGNRLLQENFYIRGDGTRVYFFENSELENLFKDKFEIIQNGADKRLIVNRQRKIKMHRVWLQAKFKKIG